MNTYILGIACIAMCMSGTAHAQKGGSSGNGWETAVAKGIMKKLFKDGAGIAGEQAIKTATEEAVKAGVPLPAESYDLTVSLQYYYERTWGYYAGKRLTPYERIWFQDPKGGTHYTIRIDNSMDTVATDPFYFEHQKREFHCEWMSVAGWEAQHLRTNLKYVGRNVVGTQNIAHAVNQHDARFFFAGAAQRSSCPEVPVAWKWGSDEKSIGRGSWTAFVITQENMSIDYSYISYQ